MGPNAVNDSERNVGVMEALGPSLTASIGKTIEPR